MPPQKLINDEGTLTIDALPNGRARLRIEPHKNRYVPRFECETAHLDELQIILDSNFTSLPWLCDLVARFEDPDGLMGTIRRQLFAYVSDDDFGGKRILDFGCGAGASTIGMAELLPQSQLIGVELEEARIVLARKLAAHRRLRNIAFEGSQSGESLPELEPVDYVMLSAVYEHLLPSERRMLLPKLWKLLKPGGLLFVNQTPHMWFPYEHHSTGLWAVNYLPDRIALAYARQFSRRNEYVNRSRDWTVHLRGGIRGGTEREILAILREVGQTEILQPLSSQYRDRAEYWLASTGRRLKGAKRLIAGLFRLTDRLFHTVPSINLDVAIKKIS